MKYERKKERKKINTFYFIFLVKNMRETTFSGNNKKEKKKIFIYILTDILITYIHYRTGAYTFTFTNTTHTHVFLK